MNNAYTYDAVINVLGITNKAALPESGKTDGLSVNYLSPTNIFDFQKFFYLQT